MNKIPIFLSTDDNYAPFASIMMKSVLQHTHSFIEFHILDGGISSLSKKLIHLELQKYKNKSISFYSMEKFNLKQFPNIAHYTVNAFSRYFIPEIRPDIQKAIYLDVDIVVKSDIKQLFDVNLSNFPIGAVLEDFYENNYQNLKRIYDAYNGGDQYFNSGVLLLDIEKLKKMDFSQKCIDYTSQLYSKLHCPDQDVLNILFANNFKKLDYKFNYMPDHILYMEKKHPGIKIDPVIIHYTAAKPWKAKSLASDAFDNILKGSVFKKIIYEKYSSSHNITKYFLFGFIPFISIKEKK